MLISILTVVIFVTVMFPVLANAAPLMETNVSLNSFSGKWVSTRAGSLQTLKIECDADTGECRMEAVAEYSGSCSTQFGEPTGRLWEGKEQVQVIDQSIFILVDSYCLSDPPTFDKQYTFEFTYHPDTDTLTDNIGATWYREVKPFEGKWISTRAGSPQTLKLRCDADIGYCKMEAVAEYSGSCTTQFGEPTGRLWEGEGQVQVVNQTIEFSVDSYCLTEPPTYDQEYTFIFTYDPDTDTLIDNLPGDTTWHRK